MTCEYAYGILHLRCCCQAPLPSQRQGVEATQGQQRGKWQRRPLQRPPCGTGPGCKDSHLLPTGMAATGNFPVGYSWGVGVHLAELTLQETTHTQTAGKVRNRDGQCWELCLGMEWPLGGICFYVKTSLYPMLPGRYSVQKQGVWVGG